MRLLSYGFLFVMISCAELNYSQAQNYIGLTKDEIMKEMDLSYKNFKLNTNTVNPYYKYLKYENEIDEITILFFLSDDDVCTMVRKMCDYANINEELDALNQNCSKISKDAWSCSSKGKMYQVSLEEGEWYFTITTKQKK
jgi:hypothetical protein